MNRAMMYALTAVFALLLPASVLLAAEVAEEKIPKSTISFKMVKVPGGKVDMVLPDGSSKEVEIKPFWIGQTEVQWQMYDWWAFEMDLDEAAKTALLEKEKDLSKEAKSRPSKPYGAPDRGFGHDGYPAISIAYDAAVKYCVWLSQVTGKKYRLATEAEWEYACRGGGSAEKLAKDQLDKVAWFTDNSEADSGDKTTHPCGSKEANAFGLYDMLGNAGEWVVGIDGKPALKGGHYEERAPKVHARARSLYNESWQVRDPQDPKSKWWLSDGPFVGFRVVRDE